MAYLGSMKQRIFLGAAALSLLAGCGEMAGLGGIMQQRERAAPVPAEPIGNVPTEQQVALPAPEAVTVEEFDTTTEEDRVAAAAAPDPAGEVLLGTTVASLGDPAKPGFWLETPLVDARATGRVEFPQTGQSAQVDLIPIDGPATGGSRISLAAMRLIGAPLTGLPELRVYRN